MAAALGEEAGVLLGVAALGGGELGQHAGDVGLAAGFGVEVEHTR